LMRLRYYVSNNSLVCAGVKVQKNKKWNTCASG
jgi:hypothetical protein